jgi:hypothetical protein
MERVSSTRNMIGSMTTMFTMTWVIPTSMKGWLVPLLEDPTPFLTLEGGELAGNQLKQVIILKFYLKLMVL